MKMLICWHVRWGAGARDKKGASKQAAGKVGDDDDDGKPRALQVDLSVRLCLLTCDTDTQHAVAAAAGDVEENKASAWLHHFVYYTWTCIFRQQ